MNDAYPVSHVETVQMLLTRGANIYSTDNVSLFN